jgi:hypothetical protein
VLATSFRNHCGCGPHDFPTGCREYQRSIQFSGDPRPTQSYLVTDPTAISFERGQPLWNPAMVK